MKIAICDDNPKDLEQFLKLVKIYEKTNQKDISAESFTSGEVLLQKFQKGIYDAVFLDIYLKGMSGVDVAKAIRKTDENVRLVFTTASSDHFSDGFAVEASHYLVKPLTEEKVSEALRRIRNIYAGDEDFLCLPGKNGAIKIPQSQILYIETIRNGIEIHCRGESISVRCSLSSAMEQLDSVRFLKCHRCFAVNLEAVEKMEADSFLMDDGRKILIRKDGRREIKEACHHYIMRRLRGDLS